MTSSQVARLRGLRHPSPTRATILTGGSVTELSLASETALNGKIVGASN